MPYVPEAVRQTLGDVDHIVLAGASEPVSFFAYPQTPSRLAPENCEIQVLAESHIDVENALEQLVALTGAADALPLCYERTTYDRPTGGYQRVRLQPSLPKRCQRARFYAETRAEALQSWNRLRGRPLTLG